MTLPIPINAIGHPEGIAGRAIGAGAGPMTPLTAAQIRAISGTYSTAEIDTALSSLSVLAGLGSVDNAVLRADGTGGSTAQGSPVTISDTGVIDRSDGASTLSLGNVTGGVNVPGDLNADRYVYCGANLGFYSETGSSQTNLGIAGVAIITLQSSGAVAPVNRYYGWSPSGSNLAADARMQRVSAGGGGIFASNGTTLGTWHCATLDNPSASVAIGNVTYGMQTAGTFKFGEFTVAGLPSAAANARRRCDVSDSTVEHIAANIGAIVAGGGSYPVTVISDGTNWRIR